MKKIIFIAILLASSPWIQAQFKKGMRMAGNSLGSMVYNSGEADITVAQVGSTTSRVKAYNLLITPSLGWFIQEATAVGVTLHINPKGNNTRYEQNGSAYQKDQSNSFHLGIGGFVRNYFRSAGSLKPFGQLSVNGGISTLKTEGFFYGGSGPSAYKDTYTGSSNGGSFFNAGVQVGVTRMVGALTGLDFFIGYNFSSDQHVFKRTTTRDLGNNGSIDERGENETTTRFTNHGLQVGVGFQVFLNAGN